MDTRFSYCATRLSYSVIQLYSFYFLNKNDHAYSFFVNSCLSLLGELFEIDPITNEKKGKWIDLEKACQFILSCQNFDGGFGAIPGCFSILLKIDLEIIPGGESHAGQIFTCVGTLKILDKLDLIDQNLLCWWLSERQCDSGGLNGRPEKQADVCYSWWIISSLDMMDKVNWINTSKLVEYILNCQDQEEGGISDRPGNVGDIFHTFFGICGLNLLNHEFGQESEEDRLRNYEDINSTYCLPQSTIQRLHL